MSFTIMARPKKNGEHVTLYLEKDILDTLRKYADEKGQTMTLATERILKAFFDEHYCRGTNEKAE